MCFYLPWIIALVLWLLLLRSLKRHEKRFQTEISGANFNQSSLHKNSHNNSKSSQVSNEKEKSVRTRRRLNYFDSEKGLQLYSKEKETITSFGSCRSLSAKMKVSDWKAWKKTKKNTDTTNFDLMMASTSNNRASIGRLLVITKQREKNVNKITLMVIILCFTNLICRYI
jgi:uncharacterized protein YcfL